MTSPTATTARLGQPGNTPRSLVLRLRGGEEVSGTAFIPTIQSLAPFLASRRGGLLTLSKPSGETRQAATATHVMIRLASVLHAWSPDATLAVEHRAPGPTRRHIRITFDDHTDVEGVITCPAGQRVSDFLARAEDFVVLRQATIDGVARGQVDLAVHLEAVNTIRDLGPAQLAVAGAASGAGPAPAARRTALPPQGALVAAGATTGGGAPPPRQTVVKRRTSSLTLVSFDDL